MGSGARPRPCFAHRMIVAALLLPLAACASDGKSGPEAWWHDAVGGAIAEQRPPPPGATDKFPNLATVPEKPAKPNDLAMTRATAGLLADRIAARQAEAVAPIPAPDGRPAPAPVAPPAQTAASASREARAKPQTPAVAPAIPVTQAALPPLPVREPARAGTVSVAPPLEPARVAPPSAAPAPDGATQIAFTAGSSALNADAETSIKALAAARGTQAIAIAGHGETVSGDPLIQSAALGLALSRAQAVATALAGAGVPGGMVRISAEAAGRGATLRLLR